VRDLLWGKRGEKTFLEKEERKGKTDSLYKLVVKPKKNKEDVTWVVTRNMKENRARSLRPARVKKKEKVHQGGEEGMHH